MPLARIRVLAAALLLSALVPRVSPAQSAAATGTIVVAHGGDSLWNAGVLEAARAARTVGPVEVSFLMGAGAQTARFQDAVARLERAGVREIVVVPLLVSSYSGHYEQIRFLVGEDVTLSEVMAHHLHMSGIERPTTRVPLRLARALDDAGEMATVLSDRALAAVQAAGDVPSARALLIVGHGPNSAEDYAEWMRNLRPVAERVKAATGFQDVRVELVRDDAPAAVRAEAVLRTRELIAMQRLITGRDVIVVPVLVSKGSVSRDKLPADIRGTPSHYAPEPLLPHPAISRWIETRVRETATSRQSTATPANH